MYDFMKKVPGGLLLVPMLISALFCTFAPGIFEIGGATQAIFTADGLNYIIGFACLCSGASIDLSHLSVVLRKEGVLILVKVIINIVLGLLFIQFFDMDGVWGISAIAYIAAIASTNPSLFLALESDYGTKDDISAFGLVGLLCTPAYPMLVFSISQTTAINWTPIISTIIPVIVGAVLGNLDPKMRDYLAPGAAITLPFMGFAFGANINLIDAIKAGPQGVLLTILFYIPMVLIMVLVERYLLKEDGVTSLAMSSIAGMSVSVPAIIGAVIPSYQEFVASATAQIAFGVVISSIITPIIARKLYRPKETDQTTLA
ncbi:MULTISPECIES: 2-keto-3-deoxygluconate permease [Aerococcus]|uniref:2-keto-3-deoxygluconate permease n=1 Tax=Aerococcus mictus TaxID=2976810 RepID=A0ABZ2EAI5_9LACT|nr:MULTISPECIES: 2-keto-3-deoxygluconate permease [Aerococcus]MDK6597472.1 2-keto-3-deoxygluconate permease [Aerococcus urinae]MDK7303416.1 2-keto-3-deoxygluconate permease [Aerococcus urinae]MDL5174906.1 2-keto-3-deoxygluconate permease [Aerococcus mictus]RAV69901.1 2-keto-3-deoxygluconate permease [Aerococcus urinae]RAW04154.1 2-keto-3-deoxygluconate permease [Aerococcus urinae]